MLRKKTANETEAENNVLNFFNITDGFNNNDFRRYIIETITDNIKLTESLKIIAFNAFLQANRPEERRANLKII